MVEPSVLTDASTGEGFTFDKEFFLVYHPEMSQARVDFLNASLAEIYQEGALNRQLLKSSFIPNFKPSEAASNHLKKKVNEYAKVIAMAAGEKPTTGLLFTRFSFEQSHLFFPKIISILGVLILGLVLVLNRSAIGVRLRAITARGWWTVSVLERKKTWGTVGLTLIYFWAMPGVGRLFPNTGLGFLICSVPYLFLLSCLMVQQQESKRLRLFATTALTAPLTVWLVMFHGLGITLP